MESMDITYTSKPTLVEERDVSDDWVDHILGFIGDISQLSNYTIIADGGNGTA
jgi:phosphomannomutase